MKFITETEIPDLPADVMEIVEQTGGSIRVSASQNEDDDGEYMEMLVEVMGGTDGQAADMFAALDTLPSFKDNSFSYGAEVTACWFNCYLPDAADWIDQWEAEMRKRFPNVRFEG